MKMEKPTVEAVRFTSADVIATSGQLGVTLSGFGGLDHTDCDDNTFKVGGNVYTPKDNSEDQVIAALESAGQTSGFDEGRTIFYAGNEIKSLGDLWGEDHEDWRVFNGTYTWFPTNSRWERTGD